MEKNPKQPVETYDRYLLLMEVADEVDWRLPLALSLAESTGQRMKRTILLDHLARLSVHREGWLFPSITDAAKP